MSQSGGMPTSKHAHNFVKATIAVLKRRREARLLPDRRGGETHKPMSIGHLADEADLDKGSLSRAEDGDRIPSLAFFLDWANALDTTMEEVLQQARVLLEQESKSDE